jgi:outer membrane biosynthesis protein TonB
VPGASDWRALSLLETEQPTPAEIIGGIGFTLAAFVLTPSLALVSAFLLGGMGSIFGAGVEELPPPPLEVIETRFVRLGKKRPPRRMPSKEVPAVEQTAPVPQGPDSEPVAAVATGDNAKGLAKPKKKRAERDEDLLSQLGARAGAISDLSKAPEPEGDPDGIVEGTKASGTDREIYVGKLYSYFRRGWQVPSLISDEELQKLACKVELSITQDGRAGDYEVKRPSGNEAFDESVRRRLHQTAGAKLPEPPESVASQMLGKSVSLVFVGRHAR